MHHNTQFQEKINMILKLSFKVISFKILFQKEFFYIFLKRKKERGENGIFSRHSKYRRKKVLWEIENIYINITC